MEISNLQASAESLVKQLAGQLLETESYLCCAESCTGGLLAKLCTDLEGSSAWFERGFVTYSNLSKQQMLAVDQQTLIDHGAVSEATARQMAAGALANSAADLAVAITGIAGPGGGSPDKPVGTVCFGFATKNGPTKTVTQRFDGDRDQVRWQSAVYALQQLVKMNSKK